VLTVSQAPVRPRPSHHAPRSLPPCFPLPRPGDAQVRDCRVRPFLFSRSPPEDASGCLTNVLPRSLSRSPSLPLLSGHSLGRRSVHSVVSPWPLQESPGTHARKTCRGFRVQGSTSRESRHETVWGTHSIENTFYIHKSSTHQGSWTCADCWLLPQAAVKSSPSMSAVERRSVAARASASYIYVYCVCVCVCVCVYI